MGSFRRSIGLSDPGGLARRPRRRDLAKPLPPAAPCTHFGRRLMSTAGRRRRIPARWPGCSWSSRVRPTLRSATGGGPPCSRFRRSWSSGRSRCCFRSTANSRWRRGDAVARRAGCRGGGVRSASLAGRPAGRRRVRERASSSPTSPPPPSARTWASGAAVRSRRAAGRPAQRGAACPVSARRPRAGVGRFPVLAGVGHTRLLSEGLGRGPGMGRRHPRARPPTRPARREPHPGRGRPGPRPPRGRPALLPRQHGPRLEHPTGHGTRPALSTTAP